MRSSVKLPKVIDLDMNINEEGDTLVDLIEKPNAVQPDESFNTEELLKSKMLRLWVYWMTVRSQSLWIISV